MYLFLVGIVVCCLLAWWHAQWRRLRGYWAARGVPHDPPHPLLGSLTFLQRENPALWMRKMYNKFRTPYFGIWLFWRPGLVVNSPELARRILVKDADNFRNRYLSSGKSDPIGGLNLFTVNDPLWSSLRRRLTAVFTAAKLRSMQGLVRSKAADLVLRIQHEMKDPSRMNLRVICTDYTTDVTGEAAFGVRSEAARTGRSALRTVTRDFMEFSVYRGLCWSSIFFFPALVDVFRFTLFPKATTAYLRQLFRLMVAQRTSASSESAAPPPPGASPAGGRECRDLLDALINMKHDADREHEEMSEDVLVAQAAIFLQGGFDTSGGTLTWTINELAHQPHLQERLYSELKVATEGLGTEELDSNQLAELPYLNAVIKEALRKWPPMGWLDRVATRDYRVDEQLTVSAGTVVYVNAFGLQWDEHYFPEPERFDPDRFLPENEQNIKPYTYMPFGEGPRACIGMRFAHITLRFGLASIFLKYSVRPLPGTPTPNETNIEKKGMLLMPEDKISVLFTPRN